MQFFERSKDYKTLTDLDKINLDLPGDVYRFKNYPGIVKDPKEFWKYMMNEGMIHFLIDVYDEKKYDLMDEFNLERKNDNPLSDDFSVIKTNLVKMKILFDFVERDFRIRKEDLTLDSYKPLLNKVEELIPKREIIKFGKNFRIGVGKGDLNIEKYDTVNEDFFIQGSAYAEGSLKFIVYLKLNNTNKS